MLLDGAWGVGASAGTLAVSSSAEPEPCADPNPKPKPNPKPIPNSNPTPNPNQVSSASGALLLMGSGHEPRLQAKG